MDDEMFRRRACENLAKRKQCFLNCIKQSLAPFINSEQNNFDWEQLKYIYNNRKKLLITSYCLRMFCEFAFKMFVTFNCQDDDLVIKIVRMYQKMTTNYSRSDLCRYCSQFDHFPRHYLCEGRSYPRSMLMRMDQSAIEELKYTNRHYYGRLTVHAIHLGNYGLLQFLVKHGISYFPDDVRHQVRLQIMILFRNYIVLNPLIRHLAPASEQFAEIVLQRLNSKIKNPNFRRIYLTMLTIDVILCKCTGDSYYGDYAKSLKLYLSTLPEAEISMKDVRDVLCLVFSNERDFEPYDQRIHTRFKEIFQNMPSLPSPRSLKYLCRCKIRDCIQKCPSLMSVLSKMSIPISLKDYLLCISD